jgi:hypothetical protein
VHVVWRALQGCSQNFRQTNSVALCPDVENRQARLLTGPVVVQSGNVETIAAQKR